MNRPLVDLRRQPIIGESIRPSVMPRPVGERGPESVRVELLADLDGSGMHERLADRLEVSRRSEMGTLRWWGARIVKAITNMEATMDALTTAVDSLIERVKATDDAKDAQITALTAHVAELTTQLADVPAQITRLDAIDPTPAPAPAEPVPA